MSGTAGLPIPFDTPPAPPRFAKSNLKVSELSKDKKEFVSKALTSSRQKFDKFLTYMPVEKVSAARAKGERDPAHFPL